MILMAQRIERAVLERLLANKVVRILIAHTGTVPLTAMELSSRHGIPISKCYGYLNLLVRYGVMDRQVLGRTAGGRRIIGFRSNLSTVFITEISGMVKCTVPAKDRAAYFEI